MTTRVLTFSTLFPNRAQPNHGIFVENRLRHTFGLGGLDILVIAPVPYFPFQAEVFGRYGAFARAPREEVRHGVRIIHPRFLAIPKLGTALAPFLLYHSALKVIEKLYREGTRFDVIDAHYYYPDGVAAAMLGQKLNLPVAITGRGSDLTLFPKFALARRQIRWAAQQAAANITVCQALTNDLIELGVDTKTILAMRNGVDLSLFKPVPREEARSALDVRGFVLLSVGHLISRKGHHILIEALKDLTDCTLVIAGEGPMRHELERLASELGVAGRVRLLGEIPHSRLASIYSASDVLLLASDREGWPNVLLEAMACGTPVAATNVNGTPEIVSRPEAGCLIEERTAPSVVRAVRKLQSASIDRRATRKFAETMSWQTVAEANRALLTGLAESEEAGRRTTINVASTLIGSRHLGEWLRKVGPDPSGSSDFQPVLLCYTKCNQPRDRSWN